METKQKNPALDLEIETSKLTHGKGNEADQVPYEDCDSSYSWQHFSVICSVEIVDKVKTIAHNEGFSIREVVEKFLGDGIARYEHKHGTVAHLQKDINDIL
jgi:hypothetical protein